MVSSHRVDGELDSLKMGWGIDKFRRKKNRKMAIPLDPLCGLYLFYLLCRNITGIGLYRILLIHGRIVAQEYVFAFGGFFGL